MDRCVNLFVGVSGIRCYEPGGRKSLWWGLTTYDVRHPPSDSTLSKQTKKQEKTQFSVMQIGLSISIRRGFSLLFPFSLPFPSLFCYSDLFSSRRNREIFCSLEKKENKAKFRVGGRIMASIHLN